MRFPPGQGRRDDRRSLMTTFRRRVAEWRSPSLRQATLWAPQVRGGSRVRDGRMSRRPPEPPLKPSPFLHEPQASGRALVSVPRAWPAGWKPRGPVAPSLPSSWAAPSCHLLARLAHPVLVGARLTFVEGVGGRRESS